MDYFSYLTIVSILHQFVDSGRMFTEGQLVINTRTHTHTHTYIYIYIYIHTYARTQARACGRARTDVNKSELSAQRGPFRSLREDKCCPYMEVRCEHVEQPDKAGTHKYRSKDASP